jgi:hypothetical protein
VWATVAALASDVVAVVSDGVTAEWVAVEMLESDGYIVVVVEGFIVVCVTAEVM